MDAQPNETSEAATFGSFELDSGILEAVAALGFDTATPIQAAAIPVLLSGKDVIGGARTGSGKTAAFGIPLLERVKDGGPQRALILAPTRELALQVTEALRDLAKRLPVRIVCIYGGASYDPQIRAIRKGATVVVATPGRLLDLMDRKALSLDAVETLVLDEADEMLRMGFIDDVERVLEAVSDDCQVALFSATMPDEIQRIAKSHLNEPVDVHVEDGELMVGHIQQWGIKVPHRRKLDALIRVLLSEPDATTLVFARTRRSCAEVADALCERGIAAEALHGDLNQSARERVVARLRSGNLKVVIATDVAARGIDVDHLTHVINYDLPTDTEGYVHRIGRTGRAGRDGTAISFVAPSERRRMRFLEKDLDIVIEPRDIPSDSDIARARRNVLLSNLEAMAGEDDTEEATAWLNELTSDGERSMDDLAAAAIALLARTQGGPLGSAPAAARGHHDDRDHDGFRERRGRDRDRSDRGHRPDPANEVQIVIGTGKRWNVRPGDIVGALAGETGISGSSIGKITLLDKITFVGMPADVAEQVLSKLNKVEIRGVEVFVDRAREGRGPSRSGSRGSGNRGGSFRKNRGFKDKGRGRGGSGHSHKKSGWKRPKRFK